MSNIEEKFDNMNDFCRIYNLNPGIVWDKINNFEEEELDPNMQIDILPREIINILECGSTSIDAVFKFMRHFGLAYYEDNKLRITTKKAVFFFTNDDYIGVYPSVDVCMSEASRRGIRGSKVLYLHLFPKCRGCEIKESI